jgi:hypothetical protein
MMILTAAVLLAAAPGLRAQTAPATPATPTALTIKPDPSGEIRVLGADGELVSLALNAHGPQWKHAPQSTATATSTALPGGAGQKIVGTLPVPNTDGGALKFTETLTPLPSGFRVEYEVGVTQALKLNGLQVSLLLPVARFGGKELRIERPEGDPQLATFPVDQRPDQPGIWGGEGSTLAVAPGTEQAITIELLAPADVVVQDLRQWEQPVFEIRFPALMEESREIAADDQFHLVLTVTFAAPLKWAAP